MSTPLTPPGGINVGVNPLSEAARGGMRTADNCVIPSRDKMEPRRGETISAYATSVAATRCAEVYAGNLLLATDTTLERDTGSAFSTLVSFDSFGTGQRMRFVGGQGRELDGSLYFTTPEGPLVLDSISGTARLSGIPRPGDFYVSPVSSSLTQLTGNVDSGWLAKDRAVAYRAVFGRRDANNNIALSAPSGRLIIPNPADVTVPIGGLVRLANTVTATVTSHGFRFADKVSLTLSGGDVGNFSTANNSITSQPPSALTPTQFQWAETAADYTNVAEVVITSGSKNVFLAIDIPSGIIAGDFVQVYRTLSASGATTDPGDECYLAYERVLTATDITNTYATITDTTPDAFLGEPLYSNANTGDGLEQANDRPPLATDLTLFDARAWYLNTTDRHRLSFRLLGTGASVSGLQSTDAIAINTRVFTANNNFLVTTEYGAAENIYRTIQSFVYSSTYRALNLPWKTYATSDGDNGTGGVLVEERDLGGTFSESALTASNPDAIYAATTRPSAFAERLATLLEVTEASSSRTGSTVTITTASAHGFSPGQVVMLAYRATSTVDANFPVGMKTIVTTPLSTTFTYTETGSAATMTGTYYVYATTFKSTADQHPAVYSKSLLPQATPLLNYIADIPRGQTVLRGAPLRSSLYLFLQNGDIWTVSGTFPYRVEKFDGTATLIAADTLVEHNNRLLCLTTQGVVAISEAGVEILDDAIKTELLPLIAAEEAAGTLGSVRACSYESEHQYRLYLSSTNSYAVYVYNSLYRRWTKQSDGRAWGLVRRSTNKLYEGHTTLGRYWLERKSYGRADFADYLSFFDSGTTSTSTSIVAATLFAGQVAIGDVLLDGLVGSHTSAWTVTNVTGSVGSQTITASINLNIGPSTLFDLGSWNSNLGPGSLHCYRPITSTLSWLHEAMGAPQMEKTFRDLCLHFSRYSCSTATATLTGIEGSTAGTGTISSTAPQAYSFATVPTVPISKRVNVDDSSAYLQMTPQLAPGITFAEAFAVWTLLGYTMEVEAGSERMMT